MATAKHFVVFVTTPGVKVARALAKGALEQKLVACANLLPKVESHYWWEGKIDSSAETLMVFKTTGSRLKKLEQFVLANHPYETAEFIALPIAAGSKRYLQWITDASG
jgi:periplasmic divalent cation tolerance protein